MEVNFVEVSPGPVKFALARMGFVEARLAVADGSAAGRVAAEGG